MGSEVVKVISYATFENPEMGGVGWAVKAIKQRKYTLSVMG